MNTGSKYLCLAAQHAKRDGAGEPARGGGRPNELPARPRRARGPLSGCLAVALCALAGAVHPGDARAQQWNLESGPMRIPSLEELSLPHAPRGYNPAGEDQRSGPLSRFLHDSTLKNGDVVMTPDGPMRFRGQDSFSHRAEDFVPVEPGAPMDLRPQR